MSAHLHVSAWSIRAQMAAVKHRTLLVAIAACFLLVSLWIWTPAAGCLTGPLHSSEGVLGIYDTIYPPHKYFHRACLPHSWNMQSWHFFRISFYHFSAGVIDCSHGNTTGNPEMNPVLRWELSLFKGLADSINITSLMSRGGGVKVRMVVVVLMAFKERKQVIYWGLFSGEPSFEVFL